MRSLTLIEQGKSKLSWSCHR